jgi:hypothetical protein
MDAREPSRGSANITTLVVHDPSAERSSRPTFLDGERIGGAHVEPSGIGVETT